MNMLKSVKITIFIIALLFISSIFSTLSAQAQTVQQIVDSIQNNIQVSITPQYPKAGDNVVLHLQSSDVLLDQATISWIIGGKVISKGLSLTDFSVTAGKIGSKTTITARIVTANGSVANKIITIQPADIDLLWQTASYVPPFYQGKALYPHQGLITFTAIPNIAADKSITKSIGTYVYTWKKDGDILSNFSGYGKNTFTLRGPIISRSFTMQVDVSSAGGVSLGTASVTVTPRAPQVAFYENNPLLGVLYNKNLSNYTMQDKELSIVAVPFFFNTDIATEPASLQYKWTMNGNSIASQNDPSILTVRNTTGANGSATVGLQINNLMRTLQFASRSMSITFEKNNNQTGL